MNPKLSKEPSLASVTKTQVVTNRNKSFESPVLGGIEPRGNDAETQVAACQDLCTM